MSVSELRIKPHHAIREDWVNGLIHVIIQGLFDQNTLEQHLRAEKQVVDRWRRQDCPIRVLIDAVDLLPHSPEGQARVQRATGAIYRSGDRVAIQVSSSLVKMQMRRIYTQGNTINFFLSNDAARMWLDARPGEHRH